MSRPVSQRAFAVMILGTIGFITGIGLLLYDATAEDLASKITPELLLWFILRGTGSALMAILAVSLGKELWNLKQYLAGNKLELAISSLVYLLLYWVPFFGTAGILGTILSPGTNRSLMDELVQNFIAKDSINYALAFLIVALPAAIGMWLVRIATATLFTDIEPHPDLIQHYLCLRTHLQRFISIIGAFVGLATLTAGAWRKAAVAFLQLPADAVPPNGLSSLYVLIFGAYFTLLGALVYLPVYASLVQAGHRIRDAFVSLPSPDSDSWSDAYRNREDLSRLLELRVPMEQSFKTSVAIVAPLLGGIISLLLE